jgi:hypothetical protein
MNEERLNEELSAYLDDESPDAGRIARLLQSDERAARRYTELSKLSAHLKSLPAPDVHPAFATRVLAQARETQQVRAWPRAWRIVPVGALVLAATCTLSWVAFRSAPVAPATDQEAAVVLELRHNNAPLGPLATLFDEDMMLASNIRLNDGRHGSSELYLTVSDESIDTAVESIEWLASAESAGSESQEIDAMLRTLDDTQIAVLKELLIEYAMEDNTI